MQNIKRKKDNSKDKKRINRTFSILHFLDMEVATKSNNANLFPNSLTLHIYKSILLFITPFNFSTIQHRQVQIVLGCLILLEYKYILNQFLLPLFLRHLEEL